jgi:hypothetical protein
VRFRDLLAVAIAKYRFEDDPDRDGKAGDPVKARLLKCRKGIELSLFARAGIEFTKSVEVVVGHYIT